jgi:hypothetical protein
MTTAIPERLRDDQDFRGYWSGCALSITGSLVTAMGWGGWRC